MKKSFKYITFLLIMYLLLPLGVFAKGSVEVSTSKISVQEGATATFEIKASNAAGRVDVTSSDNEIVTVVPRSNWVENGTVTVTVKAISKGSTSILVKLTDVATFDEEQLKGSYLIEVNVKEKATTTTKKTTKKTTKTTKKTTTRTTTKKLDTDASLKRLEVVGYSIGFNRLTKSYSLDVPSETKKLEILAEPNSTTSVYKINGASDLRVGENTITITVSAQDGTTEDYVIKVNRSGQTSEEVLEEIASIINETTSERVTLTISDDTIISNEIIKLIKESGKNVTFNHYDTSNRVVYSWSLESANLDDEFSFDAGISFSSNYKEVISELVESNNVVNLNFSHSGNLPENTKVKVYVGDKFGNYEKVSIYYYNPRTNKVELTDKDLIVNDGYVEFAIDHCSEYVVVNSTIMEPVRKGVLNQHIIYMIIGIVIIMGLGLTVKYKKI